MILPPPWPSSWLSLWSLVPLSYLAVVTVPLAVTDVRTRRLPNALVVPGLVLLGWALVWAGFAGSACAVAGLVGVVAVGLLLAAGWMLGAVGMGDVKLGAWLGGLAGVTSGFSQPFALAHGLAAGAAVAGALVVAEVAAGAAAEGLRIPFGPPLLAAFWVATGVALNLTP